MPKHALLSASSSHRWLNCPPSARLCEGYDDKGSDFATEGTDAHALCEFKLRTALGMEARDPTEDLTWYNSEMEECANGYVSFVMELVEEAKKACPDPVVLIEQRLDYSKYVEEGFGTGDCVIIADGTLHIVDYKHGRGVLVEADDNPQQRQRQKRERGRGRMFMTAGRHYGINGCGCKSFVGNVDAAVAAGRTTLDSGEKRTKRGERMRSGRRIRKPEERAFPRRSCLEFSGRRSFCICQQRLREVY